MTTRILELAVPLSTALSPTTMGHLSTKLVQDPESCSGGTKVRLTEGKWAVRAIVLYFWAGTTLAAHSQNRVWLAENERNHINQ